jgi:transposase-like protein
VTRRAYSDQERADALELYVEHGLAEAARLSGVPRGTLSSWARRAGVHTDAAGASRARARTEAARARWAEVTQEHREELAGRLLAEVHTLLDQVQEPTTYHHVVTLSGGRDAGASAAVVPVEVPHPVAKDQQARVAAVAALVEKLQLLTGQATERHDLGDLDMEAELRTHQAQQHELHDLRQRLRVVDG